MTENYKKEYKQFTSECKIHEEGGEIYIEGLASTFGNIDRHGDIISEKAFDKQLESLNRKGVGFLDSHSNQSVGAIIGKAFRFWKTEKGLMFRAKFAPTERAQEARLLAKEGFVDTFSIGFMTHDDEWKGNTRTIKEVEILEISLVAVPANAQATMTEVKSNKKEIQTMSEEKKNEEKAASDATSSDLKAILGELKTFKESGRDKEEQKALTDAIKAEVSNVKTENKELKREIEQVREEMKEIQVESTGFSSEGGQKDTRIQELKSLQLALKGDRAQYREQSEKWAWGDEDPRHNPEFEGKALSSIVDQDGGLLIVPSLNTSILEKRRQLNHIRRRATVIPNAAAINERITFEHDGTFPARHETSTTTVESISDILGKSRFVPFQRALIIKIPERLLSGSVIAFEAMIVNHYSRRLAELEENDFLNGDGSELQAEGLLPAIDAISSQIVTAFDSAGTGIAQFNKLVDAKQTLLPEYKQSMDQIVWLVSNETMGNLMKMVDGNNRPYFLNPTGGMFPVLGYEAIELSNFADHAAATDAHVALLANLSFFEIYDRASMKVQRLNELYAAAGQIGLRLTVEYDAGPIDKLAFVLVEHV